MIFARSRSETARLAAVLRQETVGGALLLLATVLALTWANSPWSEGYRTLRDTRLGPSGLDLDLTVGSWSADGLLAIFFFVVGLELKREFVAGDLRDPRRAALPVAAAVAGMVGPAVIYVAINLGTNGDALRGWAIPTATDIAFALAVLAVVGSHLPPALRTFLLTLAVVDDLLAITIIAVFFTRDLNPVLGLLALVPLAGFTVLVQRRITSWWLLLPLAAATWTLVHASGVHATVAGVLLGFAVPVLARSKNEPQTQDEDQTQDDNQTQDEDQTQDHNPTPDDPTPDAAKPDPGPAEQFEHRFRPLSAGLAVPVFAFFSAGVSVGGFTGLGQALSDPIAVGVMVGLVLGKTIGVFGATFAVSRLTRAELDADLAWIDILGLALLAGVGFTVSLLIGELAFGPGSVRDEHVKVGVLAGSLIAASLAGVLLRLRDRHYRAALR